MRVCAKETGKDDTVVLGSSRVARLYFTAAHSCNSPVCCRTLKAHFLTDRQVVFTELTEIIRAKMTPRLEVAKLFHCLLCE